MIKKIKEIKISNYAKIISLIVIGVLSLTIGYASLSTKLNIEGDLYLSTGVSTISIADISAPLSKNGAVENYEVTYSDLLTTYNGALSSTDLTSELSYFITFYNSTSFYYEFDDYNLASISNDYIVVETEGLSSGFHIASGDKATLRVVFKYNPDLTEVPSNNDFGAMISFNFSKCEEIGGVREYQPYASHDLLLNLRGYTAQENLSEWSDNLGNKLTLHGDAYRNNYYDYYYFDGDGDYAEATRSYIPATGDFTLEVYLKTQVADFKTDEDQCIVSQISNSANSDRRFKVNIRKKSNAPAVLQTFYNNESSTNPQIAFLSSITPNTNYHVQLVRKGAKMYYFANGILVNTFNLAETETISTENLKLAKWNTTPQAFTGGIYAVRVYDTALNSKQIDPTVVTDELELNYLADLDNYKIVTDVSSDNNLYNYCIAYDYTESGSGLYYDVDFDRYFFRGTGPQNYLNIKYDTIDQARTITEHVAGYRVVGLEHNKTVKIISTEKVGPIAYDEAPPADQTGFCVGTSSSGCNPWTTYDSLSGFNQDNQKVSGAVADESSLNTYLNTTWYNSLGTLKDHLIQGTYAVGRVGNSTTYEELNEQSVNKYWTGYVALPTFKMILDTALVRSDISGGTTNITLDSYISNMSVANSIDMWTMTGFADNNWDVWAVISPTQLSNRRSSRTNQEKDYFYAFPVIDISGNTIVSGNGTISLPFLVDYTVNQGD